VFKVEVGKINSQYELAGTPAQLTDDASFGITG
jgi:hypothetical protein